MDESSTTRLLEHVLLPVAHEDDARETALALEPYSPTRVTVTHVVEKGGGTPDKTPVSHSEEVATTAYDEVHRIFPDAETHTTYEEDVVEGIFDAARDVEATAIAFQAREGGRIVRFLSGDISLKLVTNAEIPVVCLPSAPSKDTL